MDVVTAIFIPTDSFDCNIFPDSFFISRLLKGNRGAPVDILSLHTFTHIEQVLYFTERLPCSLTNRVQYFQVPKVLQRFEVGLELYFSSVFFISQESTEIVTSASAEL